MSKLIVLVVVLALLLISWYVLTQDTGAGTMAVLQQGEDGVGGDDQNVTSCGDGVIQWPNSAGVMEECEVGIDCVNLDKQCNFTTCKCIPQDVPSDETHTECDEFGTCMDVAGAGWNQCSADADCVDDADGMHMECAGESCVAMPGPGLDECAADDDCAGGGAAGGTGGAESAGEVHAECIGRLCLAVPGPGLDECSANDDCAGEEEVHTDCAAQTCIEVDGPGEIECVADADCVAEEPDDGMHNVCEEGTCMAVEGEGPNECQSDFQCRHYECVAGSSCQPVMEPGTNECYVDEECEGTYYRCENKKCVKAYGEGRDECVIDAECEFPTHRVCILDDCVEVEGPGQDECYVNAECTLYHTECQDGQCVPVEGEGDFECMVDEDCEIVEPPDLDCEEMCGEIDAVLVAQGLPSKSVCKATAKAKEGWGMQTCTSTCVWTWFYRVDNKAGWDSCCCGEMQRFDCFDCPGQNPVCEDPDDICPANAPYWYEG